MAAHGYFGHTHTNPNKYLSGFLWTKPLTALESGFKMMRFRCPDSLVSCGPKVHSCKKVCGFENIQIRVDGAFIAKVFTETIMHLFYTPRRPPPPPPQKKNALPLSVVYLGTTTMAAVTSGLLSIVKTGITIVSYFGNVTASLFALTIVRKFTPRWPKTIKTNYSYTHAGLVG